jgi:hypothetical protein
LALKVLHAVAGDYFRHVQRKRLRRKGLIHARPARLDGPPGGEP